MRSSLQRNCASVKCLLKARFIIVQGQSLWKEIDGKLFIYHHQKPSMYKYMGGNEMAKCPKCGTEVSKPKKTWKMAGRPDKSGKRMELEIGLYECPKDHKPFREVLNKRKI
jgi:hypothetical protein